jgi:hypothetical protein
MCPEEYLMTADDRQPDDTEPTDHGNTCWVPVLRLDGRDLEARRTIWYLAVEGNAKARKMLRDGPGTDG